MTRGVGVIKDLDVDCLMFGLKYPEILAGIKISTAKD